MDKNIGSGQVFKYRPSNTFEQIRSIRTSPKVWTKDEH